MSLSPNEFKMRYSTARKNSNTNEKITNPLNSCVVAGENPYINMMNDVSRAALLLKTFHLFKHFEIYLRTRRVFNVGRKTDNLMFSLSSESWRIINEKCWCFALFWESQKSAGCMYEDNAGVDEDSCLYNFFKWIYNNRFLFLVGFLPWCFSNFPMKINMNYGKNTFSWSFNRQLLGWQCFNDRSNIILFIFFNCSLFFIDHSHTP